MVSFYSTCVRLAVMNSRLEKKKSRKVKKEAVKGEKYPMKKKNYKKKITFLFIFSIFYETDSTYLQHLASKVFSFVS